MNVVAAGIGDFKADSLSDDEGHRLCFELARLQRLRSIASAVEQLVRVFVGKDSELRRSG